MEEKRVIEQPASEEVYNDDWFLKDSPTQETSKINLANLKAAILDGKNVAALSDDIAPEYNPNESYVAGDLAIHNSLLYICLGATTGNWDSTKWDLTSIAELLANLDLSADNISYDNTTSGLEAENVQDAIDEVLETAGKVDDIVSHGQSLVENKISDLSSLSAVGTASGDIASFSDGSDLPMPSLKVAIEPQQDLHGYDSPWVGGSGKNKLPLNVSNIKANNTNGTWSGNNYTQNGVTFSLITDNGENITSIKVTGTASANSYLYVATNLQNIITHDSTMVLSGCSGGSSTTYALQVYFESGFADCFDGDKNIQASTATKQVVIVARNGYAIPSGGITFKPMIRLATESDATFAPYSNICPISGWDEVNVTRAGKNLWGGEKLADDIVAKVPQATKDTTNKTVTYAASQVTTIILFDKFKENTQYTVYMSTNSTFTNMVIEYEDGSVDNISPNTYTVTAVSKRIQKIVGRWSSGTTVLKYEECGIFEGVITAQDFEPYNGQTYTLDLDGTRYGGKVDLVSGELTVTYAKKALADISKSKYGSYQYGIRTISNFFDSIPNSTLMTGISNTFVLSVSGESYNVDKCSIVFSNGASKTSFLISTQASELSADASVTEIDTWLRSIDAYMVYPLATPITIQLTPTQVKSLLGQNNVWADTGDILDAEYVRDLSTTINYILEQLNS